MSLDREAERIKRGWDRASQDGYGGRSLPLPFTRYHQHLD